MGSIHLVTGGCRSGKSSFAQNLAESTDGKAVYIATCPVMESDVEMSHRIALHREKRETSRWSTIEEELDLQAALKSVSDRNVVLIDCISLWISNLLMAAGEDWASITEDFIRIKTQEMILEAKKHPGLVICVTNEVGSGVVPANSLARRYRDLLGRCNQIIAHDSVKVTSMISGIPLCIKEVEQ